MSLMERFRALRPSGPPSEAQIRDAFIQARRDFNSACGEALRSRGSVRSVSERDLMAGRTMALGWAAGALSCSPFLGQQFRHFEIREDMARGAWRPTALNIELARCEDIVEQPGRCDLRPGHSLAFAKSAYAALRWVQSGPEDD